MNAQREQFGNNRSVEAGSRRVTPGVSVGASLGDIGIPGAPGESAPTGWKEESWSGNPQTHGKPPRGLPVRYCTGPEEHLLESSRVKGRVAALMFDCFVFVYLIRCPT